MIKTVKITSGENLKKIRKELGLRQREIVGDDITRNLISMIENNKTPLSYNIAIVISNNINKISEERNLGIYVEPEDIMDPKRVEAKKKVDQYIEELQNRIDNGEYNLEQGYIKEIEAFLNQWKITDKKVAVYELLSDISRLSGNREYEYMYLSKALENYFINPVRKDIYIIVVRLMENCVYTKRYSEAIRLSELACLSNVSIPEEYKCSLYYNTAISYEKLGQYDKALETLENLFNNFTKEHEYFIESLILEADCYCKKGSIDRAIEKYTKITTAFESKCGELGLIYVRLMELFKTKGLKEEVIKYRNELMNILSDITDNNEYLTQTYFAIAEMNEYLDNIELAEIYYISAMNEASERNEKSLKIKSLLALSNLYTRTNQMNKIISRQQMIKESFSNADLSDEMKLALKLISITIQKDMNNEAEDIIKDLIRN